jgi:hypothetical protein
MLGGRVRRHRLGRFLRSEYDLRALRGRPEVLETVLGFLGRRERVVDLVALGLMNLLSRFVRRDARDFVPYRMAGVTCSGIVSAALHRAYRRPFRHEPLEDTPRDVELMVGELRLEILAEASLIPL